MLRSTFFAVGLFVALTGGSFLMVDKIIFKPEAEETRYPGMRAMMGMMPFREAQKREFDPPDWAAFSLISVGSVTMLYAVALPKKGGGH